MTLTSLNTYHITTGYTSESIRRKTPKVKKKFRDQDSSSGFITPGTMMVTFWVSRRAPEPASTI